MKTTITHRVEEEWPPGSDNWRAQGWVSTDGCKSLSQVRERCDAYYDTVVGACGVRIIEVKTIERIVHGPGVEEW